MTAASVAPAAAVPAPPRVLSLRIIDVGATVLAGWLIFGVYLDGWAHTVGLPDSFWTPWHGVLYSGYGALALFLAAVVGRGVVSRRTWREAIPDGYGPSVLGAIVFAAGGFGDMIWHTVVGIEQSLDTLFSPSHLALAIGIVLLVSGPLRSAWRRGPLSRPSLAAATSFASLAMIFLILTFMFMFAQPFVRLLGNRGEIGLGELGQMRALLAVLVFTATLVGLVLLAIREGALLPGSITALLAIDAIALMTMRGTTSPNQSVVNASAVLAAGVLGDVLLWRVRPSRARVVPVRIMAALIPGAFFAAYFGAVVVRVGTGWTPHAVTGMAVMAALAGLLISYLIFPRREDAPRLG